MAATKTRSDYTEAVGEREIIGRRLFDAPRELVFSMWAKPEHIARWWGPNGFTLTTEKMEFRPGGEWIFVMHGPDGRDYPNHIVYREIVRPERITYSHIGGTAFDSEATFTEEDGKTLVTLRATFSDAAMRDFVIREYGAVEGMDQTLGRLGGEVSKFNLEPFTISRWFDAPRDLVFRLWTEEEHTAKWFGPKGSTIVYSKNDLRPGGIYLYCMRYTGGEMWGRWVYREITPPSRLVYVSSFSDRDGKLQPAPFAEEWPLQMLATVTFDARDGGTSVTVQWRPIAASAAEWETFDKGRASMTGGWTGTFEQLDAYLKTL